MAPAAVLVCRGGQHQMAGQAGLGGNFGGFTIADFTDQNNIWVLSQNSSQTAGKGHPGAQVNLGLTNTRQVVFHWILNRHNIAFLTIHLLQRGIERGGLT